MLLAGKAVYSGIVFLLLTTWISGPSPVLPASGADLSTHQPDAMRPTNSYPDEVSKMQQTLQDKGHYGGNVDGVIGLRTRASIRAYQKAESLPVTGQLDAKTAGKLGVNPEVREEAGSDAAQEKPSAGIEWAKGSPRRSKKLHKVAER